MLKKEENYKRYLHDNFNKILNYIDNKKDYSNDWYDEIVSYNNIIGSIIGLIDSKGTGKEFQDCKDLVLKYYETTYPEKQLEIIDKALYSKDCFQYINYGLNNLKKNNIYLKIKKKIFKQTSKNQFFLILPLHIYES